MNKSKSIEILKICKWLSYMKIKNYTINDDFTVDVDGNVYIGFNNYQRSRIQKGPQLKRLTEIPIQFGIVTGTFHINDNNLNSLKGCPREVQANFFCSRNENLKSLEGGPREVHGSYYCTSVAGCKKFIFSRKHILDYCEVKGAIYV